MGCLLNAVAAGIILVGFRETWHPDRTSPSAETKATRTAEFRAAILQPDVIIAILFFLLSGVIQGSLQFAFSLWADMERGWNAQQIAWSGAAIGLGFAIGSGAVLRPLLHRVGQEKTVLAGTLIDAIGLTLFLTNQHSPVLALTGLFISSLGGALWATTILGLISRDIDASHQGLALGIANGAALLGRVAGPALAGSLAVNISPGAPFGLILGCVALAIGRALTLARRPAS